MYERILVPLDGSKLAELALLYAEELAQTFGSEVDLVCVCERVEREQRPMHQLYIKKMAELVKSHIRGDAGVKVRSAHLLGEPANEIIDYAEKNGVSLIIMVSHGRSGIMPWAMGSTVSKVLQRISVPLLLVRAKVSNLELSRAGIFDRIIIPLDGSEAGEAALPYVSELTKKLELEVILASSLVYSSV